MKNPWKKFLDPDRDVDRRQNLIDCCLDYAASFRKNHQNRSVHNFLSNLVMTSKIKPITLLLYLFHNGYAWTRSHTKKRLSRMAWYNRLTILLRARTVIACIWESYDFVYSYDCCGHSKRKLVSNHIVVDLGLQCTQCTASDICSTPSIFCNLARGYNFIVSHDSWHQY